ncbi:MULTISPECIES: ABC transporter ATP-binding protein [Phyllobacteriaceae]|jgi:multiple sugar transport system ATP-binding protein|uniref:ABC transporter ATP-binding protein n=1 Tax=Mesorhizobium hungaricum TaxID=1566387 RepID=A0A1C2E548_9HYPH|nr:MULTISPECIES: sn-glycerol-3-phosphate ABC transporter ATP-binding protein UgpC [Mesorhizobium]MBN9236371.1 sn-glycerol-3-phosphate ABC transporter ATP-binding protein UgpC [Mesorhizobium sp.]MDQ0329699.1 multiple sugar transport system ATP-binding protein [Mesorhizobium sp. YL-MeA3-2017]OCX22075.1 ABC transporter ATP-binding protein [Mesorhizobium hungaricum]
MDATANTSVSIQELSLNFGTVSVLQSLNLDIAEGEFIVLLGPSGCGKSTLLNCIAGLLDISDGRIFIKGKNVTWEEPKDRGIGMVFQSYALYPQMSVEKNLSFGLKVAGTPKEEIGKRIARAAEILQIEPLLQRKPAALSGGQRQRVAIGRALVRDVDVFLFDEPLSNLDAKLRSELRVEIKRLHQRLANTMIYVTHDQIEAMTLADRIAVMRGGVIQQLDAPQAIYNRPVNRFVAGFIGSPGMNFVDGRLEDGDGGWRFTSGDLTVPLSTYAFDRQPVAGPAVLGIRPEHIGLNSGSGWPFSAKANVDVVEPMGSDTLVWGRLGAQSLSVRVPSERAPRTGEQVEIGFDPLRASLFGEDGNRL